jgi:hypothetical protein
MGSLADMLIDNAPLPSVQRGRRGVVVFIDNDALGVSQQLREMKFPEGYGHLRLAWNEFREEFVVIQVKDNGAEYFVTSAKQADGRLVDRVRRITHPSYNFAAELEKIDDEANKRSDQRFREQVGDYAERLAHAVRKDTQTKNRIIIPDGKSWTL